MLIYVCMQEINCGKGVIQDIYIYRRFSKLSSHWLQSLQWYHHECAGVSKTSVLIVYSTISSGTDQRNHQSCASLALCEGNSPVTGEFPTQRASKRNCFHLMTSSWKLFPIYWWLKIDNLSVNSSWVKINLDHTCWGQSPSCWTLYLRV